MSRYVEKNVDKKQSRKPKNVVVKDGVWYVRKSVSIGTGDGGTVQKQIWRRCEPETPERAREVLTAIEREIYFAKTGNRRPLTTFREVAEDFAGREIAPARYDADGRKISGRRSETIRISLRTAVEYFGDANISEISFGDLEDFKRVRLATPVKFKYKTRQRSLRSVNIELSFIRQIFNYAYRRRWLERSPFDDGKPLIDISAETRRDKTWTRAEERDALEFCRKSPLFAHMVPVIICIVDGGFRKGELLSAKWAEVDFDAGVMLARSYKSKSLSIRPVFLTERMTEVLTEWRSIQKSVNRIRDRSFVIGYKNIKNAWETIRKEIGRPDLRLHDLRHVFATRLSGENVPIKEISLALGHSDTKTTEIYLNPNAQALRNNARVLDALTERENE